MFRNDKVRLVANYASAVAAYYAAVAELEVAMISGSGQIYTKLRGASEVARAVCEKALKKLDEHDANEESAA
jgi:hypothetical protein